MIEQKSSGVNIPLTQMSSGKVRDSYELPEHPDKMLVVTTDRVSIFDRVLPALIPQKGMVLNAVSHFWFKRIADWGFKHHMLAIGSDIDWYLPAAMRGNPELQARAMVVKKLKMIPVEFVYRNCLTGSGLESYKNDGTVCGHKLLEGLQDGDRLPEILFTPTTKSADHDAPIDYRQVEQEYPDAAAAGKAIFAKAIENAAAAGIVLADTKFEFGYDAEGNLVLADEVLTPDSSRFWPEDEWAQGRKKEKRTSPSSLDKQPLRDEFKPLGIAKMSQEAVTATVTVPEQVIADTTHRYRYICWRLTDYTVNDYLMNQGAELPLPPLKKIVVVVGSESDLVQLGPELKEWQLRVTRLYNCTTTHVISCHRNPHDLSEFVKGGCSDADIIIAAGGWAFALPGVLDALIANYLPKRIPVIGLALGDPASEQFQAAKLSIKHIPGQPVIMDETVSGTQPYAGVEGLSQIMRRLIAGELPPQPKRTVKPAQFNVQL